MENADLNDKYSIAPTPDWAEAPSNDDVVSLVQELEKNPFHHSPADQNTVCFVYNISLRTSKERNEEHTLGVYTLTTPDLVQSAAINDYLLNRDHVLVFHRLAIIRNGLFIDKLSDQNVRILDNEQQSSQGTTHGSKKVNCVVNDLRVGDTLIIDYSINHIFSKNDFLEHSYYRYQYTLPRNNWLYRNLSLKIVQNRPEDVIVKKRFFRNAENELVNEEKTIAQGEIYQFKENNFENAPVPENFNPFLEIATRATWKEISAFFYGLYEPLLKKRQDGLRELTQEITTGLPDLAHKIQKVIEYVQDQVVYIYNSEEMHGHIPQAVEKTLEMQAGDCKAKSLLLIKLLEQLDVSSSLTLINYDILYYIPLELPSPFIFTHAIVKIYFADKEYYVDATWQGHRGGLDFRAQPYFGHYLEIKPDSVLKMRSQAPFPEYSLEENVHIDLKKGKGVISSETTYRFFAADRLRRVMNENNFSQRIQSEMLYCCQRLDYSSDILIKDYIADGSLEVIAERPDENIVIERFRASLLKPYRGNEAKVFKYYHVLASDPVVNFQKGDAILDSFVEHARKSTVVIRSDYFIYPKDTTKKNLEIDNDYFYFSNKRKFGFKTATIVSTYRPKKYGPVAPDDIENIKQAYKQIKDSNYGVGIVYVSNKTLWMLIIISLWILLFLVGGYIW